jgi:DNA-binding response OmpR family regulator
MRFRDGNGVELCRALKIESPYTPVVFYTGDVFAANRAMGLKCGSDAYLEKPYGGDIESFILELISEGQQRKVAYIYARSHRRVNAQTKVDGSLNY